MITNKLGWKKHDVAHSVQSTWSTLHEHTTWSTRYTTTFCVVFKLPARVIPSNDFGAVNCCSPWSHSRWWGVSSRWLLTLQRMTTIQSKQLRSACHCYLLLGTFSNWFCPELGIKKTGRNPFEGCLRSAKHTLVQLMKIFAWQCGYFSAFQIKYVQWKLVNLTPVNWENRFIQPVRLVPTIIYRSL